MHLHALIFTVYITCIRLFAKVHSQVYGSLQLCHVASCLHTLPTSQPIYKVILQLHTNWYDKIAMKVKSMMSGS